MLRTVLTALQERISTLTDIRTVIGFDSALVKPGAAEANMILWSDKRTVEDDDDLDSPDEWSCIVNVVLIRKDDRRTVDGLNVAHVGELAMADMGETLQTDLADYEDDIVYDVKPGPMTPYAVDFPLFAVVMQFKLFCHED